MGSPSLLVSPASMDARAIARYEEEMERHKSPKVRYRKSFEFLFGAEMINEEMSGFFASCYPEAVRNERVMESFRHMYDTIHQYVCEHIIEAYDGAPLTASEKRELGNLLVALSEGASVLWEIYGKSISTAKMARLARHLFELYMEDKAAASPREKRVPRPGRPARAGGGA